MNAPLGEVCVIIPAYDAHRTIGRAIASALREPEVVEIIVVDDASHDETFAAAQAADDGTNRLKVIRFDRNRGPAAARNAALDAGKAPLIAILDSDDFLRPGRFARLAIDTEHDWDLIADNIAFVLEADQSSMDLSSLEAIPNQHRSIGFAEFVSRNISRRNRQRSELGFMKPVLKRSILERFNLRYDERLRLGEDFILYATALARGARFELSRQCGYVAIERTRSLSGRHGTADLAALAEATRSLADEVESSGAPMEDRQPLREHMSALDAKIIYRRFLDRKRESGLLGATLSLASNPAAALHVALGLANDRLPPPPLPTYPRLLFEAGDFG